MLDPIIVLWETQSYGFALYSGKVSQIALSMYFKWNFRPNKNGAPLCRSQIYENLHRLVQLVLDLDVERSDHHCGDDLLGVVVVLGGRSPKISKWCL